MNAPYLPATGVSLFEDDDLVDAYSSAAKEAREYLERLKRRDPARWEMLQQEWK